MAVRKMVCSHCGKTGSADPGVPDNPWEDLPDVEGRQCSIECYLQEGIRQNKKKAKT